MRGRPSRAEIESTNLWIVGGQLKGVRFVDGDLRLSFTDCLLRYVGTNGWEEHNGRNEILLSYSGISAAHWPGLSEIAIQCAVLVKEEATIDLRMTGCQTHIKPRDDTKNKTITVPLKGRLYLHKHTNK